MPLQIGPLTIGPPDSSTQASGGYDPSTAYGSGGTTAPAAASTATPAMSDQRAATLAYLASQYGGMPAAPPVPAQVKDANGINQPDPSNSVYTFPDGHTATVGLNGELGPIAPPKTASQPTAADQLAAAGVFVSGNTVWQKGSDGVWAQTDASKATQALADADTQAKTALSQAQTQSAQIDAMLKADPTNVALQQQKDQATIALNTAQTASQNATAAATAINSQIAQAKAPGEIAQTAATTTNTLATAAKTNALLPTDVQTAQLAVQKAQQDLANNPNQVASQLAYQNAQTNYQNALAQSTLTKAGEPTQWTPNITAPTTQYWDPTTGTLQTQQNQNYQPTDPGRMTVQLQQQATGMQQQLQQQVAAGKLTSDQAASQFDQWWNTNVEPMKASIAQTQATQQSAIGQQQALTGYYNAEAANLPATLAQNASDAAQKNAISMLPYTTGAGFGQALGSAMSGGWKNLNPQAIQNATTFQLPNLQEIGRQGAAAALANISPTAQMHLNTPGPPLATPAAGGVPPIASLLNQSAYGFGAGAPAGAPMGGAPAPMAASPATPPVAPPAAVPTPTPPVAPQAPAAPPFDWNALLQRQQQDAATQQMQAGIPASAWGTYTPAS